MGSTLPPLLTLASFVLHGGSMNTSNPNWHQCAPMAYDVDCHLSQCLITGTGNCTTMQYTCSHANCSTQNTGAFMDYVVAQLNLVSPTNTIAFQVSNINSATCVPRCGWLSF